MPIIQETLLAVATPIEKAQVRAQRQSYNVERNRSLRGRRFIALLAIVAPALILPGCGPATTPPTATLSPESPCTIAFMRFEYGSWEERIFLIDCDGTNLRQLTVDSDVRESFPRISPDGSKIAFGRTTRDGTSDVYVMNPDGGGRTRITDDPADDDMPSWSPGGTRIAFASNRDGNMEIYMMASDGSNQKRLTNDPARDILPAWSPDGSRLAFLSDRGGSNRWWVMNSDGSDQHLMCDIPVWDEVINVPLLLLQGTWGVQSSFSGLFFVPVVTMEKQCVMSIDVAERKQGPLTYWDSYGMVETPDGSLVVTVSSQDTNSFDLRLISSGQARALTSGTEQDIVSSCRVLAAFH